ncbi:hypothetical protein BJ875DRAFT_464342 [Amylocarpus encephaloides]|uniref:Uncharacterized protein n=1 Tax=Amylocarpus encephaloides TaxID=45428 RepID=A0A9P8C4P2_9HELO|nr:hypothetical protein BJ875DRAFT_464342 [Amylocarpus encephaloides]
MSLCGTSMSQKYHFVRHAATNFQPPIFDQTEEQIKRVVEVNTISHFLLDKKFVPTMATANQVRNRR